MGVLSLYELDGLEKKYSTENKYKNTLEEYWCLYLILFVTVSAAIKIRNITVPEYVFIDTDKSVILDCDYEMGDDIAGLVVKWFLNDKMLYQWIYNKGPQSVGNFKDYLDLTYQATSDKETMYRALKIKELSLEMSGMYKCVVFTYVEEDQQSKNMVVVSKYIHIYQLNNINC